MKKASLVVVGLVFCIVALLLLAVGTGSVSAGLGCWQVRSCAGDAGCGGGSVDGCTITCTSGNTIICNPG